LPSYDHAVAPLDFATPAVTIRPGPEQGKLSWFAPAIEEIFPTPEEVAAVWMLPPVIEGSTRCTDARAQRTMSTLGCS
jgi:hypothetical protein